MPEPFCTTRRVEFIDTDMAGIVHFSNFARFAEQAEAELFRSLGLSLVTKQEDGSVVGWPRVSVSFSFKAPAYYDDVLEISIVVDRVGVKSLTMHFEFHRGETLIATGKLKTAFCRFLPDEPMRSIVIPDDQRRMFEEFVVE
jgi:YbgC/YbaW family acyl-CoA thioester hydrolase